MATKSHTLNMAGSGQVDEFFADSESQAIKTAKDMLADRGFDAPVFCDDWDALGSNDEDEPMKRMLVWACEEDSENDDGGHAIAELQTIGQA